MSDGMMREGYAIGGQDVRSSVKVEPGVRVVLRGDPSVESNTDCQAELPALMDELRSLLDLVHEEISRLDARLEPVLLPISKDKAIGSAAGGPECSPFGCELRLRNSAAFGAANRLRELRLRLAI